jgi:hypothetical protein
MYLKTFYTLKTTNKSTTVINIKCDIGRFSLQNRKIIYLQKYFPLNTTTNII